MRAFRGLGPVVRRHFASAKFLHDLFPYFGVLRNVRNIDLLELQIGRKPVLETALLLRRVHIALLPGLEPILHEALQATRASRFVEGGH